MHLARFSSTVLFVHICITVKNYKVNKASGFKNPRGMAYLWAVNMLFSVSGSCVCLSIKWISAHNHLTFQSQCPVTTSTPACHFKVTQSQWFRTCPFPKPWLPLLTVCEIRFQYSSISIFITVTVAEGELLPLRQIQMGDLEGPGNSAQSKALNADP